MENINNKNLNEIENILKKDSRFLSTEGELLKNKVYEAGMRLDTDLIKLLLSHETTVKIFFKKIDDTYVFDKNEFGWTIDSQDFLPDSYTAYSQNIILEDRNRRSIVDNNDVVLSFAYKDGLIEFDSTDIKEERDEVFYHEILGKQAIDTLTEPKLFTESVRHSEEDSEITTEFSLSDNLIIKGNNLFALHSLMPRYKGKIKLMYWDILYNTNNDKVPYKDTFKHSTWLAMMKNRLEVAHNLLNKEGSIFIQCDDNEMHYLKVLMDEIFGRDNFINTLTVKTKIAGVSGSSEGKSFIDSTEYIHVYAKSKDYFWLNNIRTNIPIYNVIEDYKKKGKSWKYTSVVVSFGKKKLLFKDKTKNYTYYSYENFESMSVKQFAKLKNISEQDVYEKYYDRIFRTTNAQSSVRKTVMKATKNVTNNLVSLVYTPIKGKNKDKETEIFYKGKSRNMFTFLSDVVEITPEGPMYTSPVSTLWDDIQYNNLNKEGMVSLPNGKKPEKLIKRIINLATNEGDIVLDAYLGSGTTTAVAHKLKRRYIGIEQLNSHYDKAIERMDLVLNGDKSGISNDSDVMWDGGGSFIESKLKELGNEWIANIGNSISHSDFNSIYQDLINNPFVTYRVEFIKMKNMSKDFEDLSLNDKREFLFKIIEKNHLYVNYTDSQDKKLEISDSDIAFSKSFYEGKV